MERAAETLVKEAGKPAVETTRQNSGNEGKKSPNAGGVPRTK